MSRCHVQPGLSKLVENFIGQIATHALKYPKQHRFHGMTFALKWSRRDHIERV
jgi:hypothetical protein